MGTAYPTKMEEMTNPDDGDSRRLAAAVPVEMTPSNSYH